MAMLTITWSGASISPKGRSASTRSWGTNTSVSTTSPLPVPRIPNVFQLSITSTPSLANGTDMFSTPRPRSGSRRANIVAITAPAGDWLAKTLRPDTR